MFSVHANRLQFVSTCFGKVNFVIYKSCEAHNEIRWEGEVRSQITLRVHLPKTSRRNPYNKLHNKKFLFDQLYRGHMRTELRVT